MIPKFRAWDKLRKRMSIVDRIYFDTEGVQLRDDGGLYWRNFRNITLMQSTGLFDKNGTEIFEGDIVGMRKHILANQHYYEVFKHRGGTFRLRNKFYGCELWLRHEHCEVLGNIYENPELMEADNDPER